MKHSTTLSRRNVWQDNGHLSDMALVAVADGQTAILPENALSHLDICSECSIRLGEQSLLALSIHEKLNPLREQAPQSYALPWVALVAAALLSAIGLLPSLEALPHSLARGINLTLSTLPHLVRLLHHVAKNNPLLVSAVSVGSALTLILAGLLLARSLHRIQSPGVTS